MENALFYTFSTIPQVLAGAIALLAAFVLYRLQTINSQIEEKSSTMQQLCMDQRTNGLWEMHVNEQFKEVYDKSENFKPSDENELRLFNLHRSKLGNLIEFKKSLLKSFNISLILTISLIIASILVLPFTPTIKLYSCATSGIFVAGLIWFIASIVCYGKLVKKAVGSQ